MKYKTLQSERSEREKGRIKAILKMRKPDGTLMFPDGLEPKDIAQQLVGINVDRTPDAKYVALIDTLCQELKLASELE